MQVLIVKTSSMGDVLHTLPALTDAMHALPGIKFDWVVEENFMQIPSWHPAVDRVIPVAIRRWRKNWFSSETRQQRCDFKRTLQQRIYNRVIDAQGLMKSAALVTHLAKGEKHGMDGKSAREPFASWFYDQKHLIEKQQHAVERTRELFAKSLGYTKPASRGDHAIAWRFLSMQASDAEKYRVFLHATTRADKHWPEENWRELIGLLDDEGIRIKLPWATDHQYQRARRLAEGFTQAEVLPRLSLEKIAAIVAGAQAVVSVDTGLSHLTAALDKPNITLYGPTDPDLIGAYGRNQIACRPLQGKVMSNISAVQVKDLLDRCSKIKSTDFQGHGEPEHLKIS